MALEFAESFAIYVTHTLTSLATVRDSENSLITRWNGIGPGNSLWVDPTHGISGGPALLLPFGASICKTFSHQATYTTGFHLNIAQIGGVGGAPQAGLLDYYNGGNHMLTLQVFADGSVQVYTNNRGGGAVTVCTSAAGVITAATNCFLELSATASGTLNLGIAAEVWINSKSVCSGSVTLTGRGVSEFDSNDATFNRIFLNAGVNTNGQSYISDLYVTNGSGTTNTGRLAGPASPYFVVGPLFPLTDGSTLQWTPNSGMTHYNRVNEPQADMDSTYLASSTPGQIDTWNWQQAPTFNNTVKSVQICFIARSTEEGSKIYQGVIGSAGTEEQTIPFGLCSDYYYQHHAFDLDPETGLAWTLAAFNSRQFGIGLIT